jgi:hypothetical protein
MITPARGLFPRYPTFRSCELLLEWECALAAAHPFRRAAEAVLFFSHGGADVEDTTIERHAIAIGNANPPEWLYERYENLRKILEESAGPDKTSGLPSSTPPPTPMRVRRRPLESEVEDDQAGHRRAGLDRRLRAAAVS